MENKKFDLVNWVSLFRVDKKLKRTQYAIHNTQDGMNTHSTGDPKAAGSALPAREPSLDFTKEQASVLIKAQGARIRELRKEAGLTIDQLADQTGLHFNTVGRIERGDSEANIEQQLLIAGALRVSPAKLSHFSESVRNDWSIEMEDENFALVDMLDVRVSAGAGALNGHNEVIGKFAFKRSWLAHRGIAAENARIIRARGESMADKINDGDILLVDTSVRHMGPDGVYVIEMDGLDYVKLLQRDFPSGGVQIVSFNPSYRPQTLTAEQAAELRISGRVVWHGGEL